MFLTFLETSSFGNNDIKFFFFLVTKSNYFFLIKKEETRNSKQERYQTGPRMSETLDDHLSNICLSFIIPQDPYILVKLIIFFFPSRQLTIREIFEPYVRNLSQVHLNHISSRYQTKFIKKQNVLLPKMYPIKTKPWLSLPVEVF